MLSNEENILYARQIILNNINLQGQYKLKQTKLLIIGAGGLGCPALIYGAALGIGYIGVIDYDFVDISNLNRQIIYNHQDLHQKKISCIKSKIFNINPFCQIITHSYKITLQNMNDIVKYYDIILDGTDNFDTRYIIEKACHTLHKAHVYGGVEQFEGQIALFNYQSNTTYSDLYPQHLQLNDTKCTNGMLGITTGIISLLQLAEVTKVIIGIGLTIKSEILIYNLLKYSLNSVRLYPKRAHKIDNYYINKLSTKELDKIQIEQLRINTKIVVIDIREYFDFSTNRINKSINIPAKLFIKQHIIKFIEYTFNTIILIIYCKSKERSYLISQMLHKYNIKHYIVSY